MCYPGHQANLPGYQAEAHFVRGSNRKFKIRSFHEPAYPPPGKFKELYMFVCLYTLQQFRVICTLHFAAKGHARVSGREYNLCGC
jgi:hypothetical protein